MKKLSFPIWCLKHILDAVDFKTNPTLVSELIDNYSGIANNQNFGASQTDSDIALAIGKLCLLNAELPSDLKSILNEGKCTEGMSAYLKSFEGGALIQLSEEVGDNGQYINVLKGKFDADAANWVWNKETADQKIREVILEYRIIVESNKIISRTTSIKSAISEWCDTCSYIRISYPAAKNYLDDFGALLEMLCTVKGTGELADSQKQRFLELISTHQMAFRTFYSNQIEVFKQVCDFYLEPYDFTDDEISDLYKTLPTNCLTREKSDYFNIVEAKIEEFNSARGSAKLKKLWLDKTGTVSPQVWSIDHSMPILCMIDDSQMQDAKSAFGALNRQKPETAAVEKAILFLESASFYEKLNSEEARDNAFRTTIMKRYSVMLPDISEVKKYLSRVITSDPYDWLGLPEVEKKVASMAEAKYIQGGCDRALEKIDSMDVADVKRYLKNLIKDNMTVGIEIIKEN